MIPGASLRRSILVAGWAAALSGCCGRGWAGTAQPLQERIRWPRAVVRQVAEAIQDPGAAPADAPEPTVVETVAAAEPARPHEIRLHLWDGSVLTGELGGQPITVQTEFGRLEVPIDRIRAIRPGLDSFPQLKQQIEQLIADLGAEDYQTRETAHRAIIGQGLLWQREIDRADEGDNAERKRHLEEIRKEYEQLMEDAEEDADADDDSSRPLLRSDAVETSDFVIVGKIEQSSFELQSKYGPLTVTLDQVRWADRTFGGALVRRGRVALSGRDFAQSGMKSTGIRLNRGDRVTLRAEGQLTLSPWGMQAIVTPDGNPSYGMFEGHPGGMLLAKIGDDDRFIKVGSKASFTAAQSGILKLGIAMQGEYANESYQFPGTYRVRIVVESSQP